MLVGVTTGGPESGRSTSGGSASAAGRDGLSRSLGPQAALVRRMTRATAGRSTARTIRDFSPDRSVELLQSFRDPAQGAAVPGAVGDGLRVRDRPGARAPPSRAP